MTEQLLQSPDLLQQKLHEMGNEHLCAFAAFFSPDGKILIGLRNYVREGLPWPVWTLPGGRCNAGETVEQALKREINEETGIKSITVQAFVGEREGRDDPTDRMYIFSCITNGIPALCEPEKFTEWRWVKIADIPENFVNLKVLALLQDLDKSS